MDIHRAISDALGPLYRVQREVRPVGDRRLFVVTEISGGPDLLVKVLPAPLSLALDDRKLEREVLLLADRLGHPRLVAPRGAGRAGTRVFYSRPFVEGTTLRAWIARSGPLLLARAAEILRDVLEALAHTHTAKLAHGDLRCENVLLTDSHAAVCDAGITDVLRRSHKSVTTGSEPDPRDDVFAVGVLAHEMLTGGPPEPEGEPLAKRRSLPAWMAKLLDGCLASDPKARWGNAGEALEQVRLGH